MALRFYRRVRLFPGVSVNLSKSGPSLSVGIRGAHVTVGRRGVTKTVGLPGTGIFYTSRTGYHSGYHSAANGPAVNPEARAGRGHTCRAVLAGVILGVFVLFVLLFLLRP